MKCQIFPDSGPPRGDVFYLFWNSGDSRRAESSRQGRIGGLDAEIPRSGAMKSQSRPSRYPAAAFQAASR